MKFFRNLIVLLAFPAAALYFTNPDESDFKEFLTLYVQDELADNVPARRSWGENSGKGWDNLPARRQGHWPNVKTFDSLQSIQWRLQAKDMHLWELRGNSFRLKSIDCPIQVPSSSLKTGASGMGNQWLTASKYWLDAPSPDQKWRPCAPALSA